jgi:hypothetical protein
MNFKLPSLNYLFVQAKDSLIRFPITILVSFLSACLGIYLVEYGKEINNYFPYLNTLLCMSIGIPLFFCVAIISEKKRYTKKQYFIINLVATFLLIIIYFTFPNSQSTHNTSLPYIKYAIYNVTAHLFVSFVPFAFTTQLNAFWHYNRILFTRILVSLIYSGFIYLGLVLALTSLKLLFDVNLHDELFVEIWIVTISIFNTWFFVGGIPKEFDELENSYDYPKGLRVFSQYVLLPLLCLYLLILYSYGSKILLTWDWPRGIVTYLIICVSVLGILTFLLIHPYGNQSEHKWIKKVSKGYYFLLFPLLIIFFIAIFIRINEYGITINRYVILLLGIWLTIICVYTSIGKTNIKFIPTSLAVILLLVSFGPWGMFSISEKSQKNRLKIILEQASILAGNQVKNETIWIKDSLPDLNAKNKFCNDKYLNDSLHNEVMSILDYLDNHHGFSSIRSWYSQDLDSIVNFLILKDIDTRYCNEAKIYMESLGLNYEYIESEISNSTIEYISNRDNSFKKVSGYDYFIDFDIYIDNQEYQEISSFKIETTSLKFIYESETEVKLMLNENGKLIDFKIIDLINMLKMQYKSSSEFQVPSNKMKLENSSKNFDIKIDIRNLELQVNQNKIERIVGDIYLKRK